MSQAKILNEYIKDLPCNAKKKKKKSAIIRTLLYLTQKKHFISKTAIL